jgi:hypothetical protein
MPLVSVRPETAMLTPILGKKPKACQFSEWYLALNTSLTADLPALSILAEKYACVATSGEVADRRPLSRIGDEVRSWARIVVVEMVGL